MANVQISDLPFATLPLIGSTTFFEVEATEGGIVVSRRVAADDLTISATTLFITGTSVNDPAIGGGVFDGALLWRNANAQQTGVIGFDPAGDNFIWSNDAEGGFHQIAIRDGTVLVETIAAASGGLLANNLLTGAGLERVLTIADIQAPPSLGSLTDVTLTAPATGAVLYKSAGDWLDTPGILIDPAADVKLHQATVEVFRTLTAAAGGAEANNTLTGGGFERVLTASDAFNNIIIGTSTDDPTAPLGGGTYDGTLSYQNSLFAATGEVGFDPAGDTFRLFNRVRRGSYANRIIDSTGQIFDAYRYDGFSGSHVWIDVLNSVVTPTERMKIEAGLDAITCVANVSNSPAAGLPQHGQFRVEIINGEVAGLFGFPESGALSSTLRMKNFVHGGAISIVGEDAGGVEREILSGDPDGSSSMSHIGAAVATTTTAAAGGLTANNLSTGAGFERVLTTADLFAGAFIGTSTDDPTVPGGTFDANALWQNANLIQIANVGFNPAGDTLFLASQVHGGKIILRGEVAAGTTRDVYEIDFDAAVLAHIWREPGGTQDLMRLDTGINAVTQKANTTGQPSGGLGQVGGFRVQNRNASPEISMFVGFNETVLQTTLELKNFVHGGPVELVGETAAGVERVLFFHDPDQVGPIFVGILDNNPATDASIQDARLTFRNPSANNIWQIGFLEGTNDFSLKLFQDTGVLRLRGSSAANADVLMATFDPVAGTELFHAGVTTPKIRTTANGFDMLGDTATNSDFDLYSLDGATLRASIRTDGAGLRIASQPNSLSVTIFARSGAGVENAGVQVTGSTGITQLYFSGAIKLLTQSQGITVRGNAAANAQLLIEGSTGVDMMTIAATGTLITFNSPQDGAAFRFTGDDAGSVNRILWEADPDGDFSAYRVGGRRAGTRFDGWTILGLLANNPATGGTQDVSLHFENSAGVIAGGIRYTTSVDMRIENFVHGGSILVLAEDAGGTLRFLLDLDPDGPNSVALYEVGVEVARTATAALGGFFANNTLTGAGFERVLTIADRTSAAVYTPTNVSTDRAYDANATTLDEIADVLGTLIADLQAIDVIQ